MKKIGGPKLGPKFGFLPFSQSCIIRLVFLDIAQDCSLGQCLSSSKAEISKKKKKKLSRNSEMIFSILMLSIIHSELLVKLTFFEQ